jgi:hypothetical protein
MSIQPFQQILLNALNINFETEFKELQPFFRNIEVQNNQIVITFSDYHNVYDQELGIVKEILLDNNMVAKISSIPNFVTAVSSTQEYTFKAYFTHEYIELIKSLSEKVDRFTAEIEYTFSEAQLDNKNVYISVTKEEIKGLEELVIARKELLEKAENELKLMKQENILIDDLKFEARKKGIL